MLRATIEIVPFGDERDKRIIQILEVANVGRVGNDVCNYLARLRKPDPCGDYPFFTGNETRLKHKRGDGAEILVAKAIMAIKEPRT